MQIKLGRKKEKGANFGPESNLKIILVGKAGKAKERIAREEGNQSSGNSGQTGLAME